MAKKSMALWLTRVVSERRIVQIDFSSWGQKSFKVSPDSKRVAYVAGVGWVDDRWVKWVVVVDGNEGKQYDGIGTTLIFSPDSRCVVYSALMGDKWFVVVGRNEGKEYDSIVTIGGGKIIFDFPDSLHYLAVKGNGIYLVEERIK